jgi:hypothetical protein
MTSQSDKITLDKKELATKLTEYLATKLGNSHSEIVQIVQTFIDKKLK